MLIQLIANNKTPSFDCEIVLNSKEKIKRDQVYLN